MVNPNQWPWRLQRGRRRCDAESEPERPGHRQRRRALI